MAETATKKKPAKTTKQQEKKPPYHVRMAEKVITALKEGTAPWTKPWQPGEVPERPYNPITGNEYKGWNSVWLTMSKDGGRDPRFCTYKQAQAQGWQVKKGAKGTLIQYWKTHDRKLKTDEQGKPVLDEKGEKQYVTYQLDRPRAFCSVVFNGADIEGIPDLPPPKIIPEQERHEKAELLLAASEAPIIHDQQNRAFYRSSTDEIHLPPSGQFNSPDAYYATALHEVGHSTGHASRLNRKLGNSFGSEDYAKEELRAEMASLMLGQELGIGHDPGQHHAYIESWIKVLEDDPQELMRASRDAEDIKEYMLERMREKELELQTAQVQEVVSSDQKPGLTTNDLETFAIQRLISNADEREPFPEPRHRQSFLEVASTDVGINEVLDSHPQADTHEFKVAREQVEFGNIRQGTTVSEEIAPWITAIQTSEELLQHYQSLSVEQFQEKIDQLGWGSDDTGIVLACAARVGTDEEYQTLFEMRQAQQERRGSTREEIDLRTQIAKDLGGCPTTLRLTAPI